MSLAEAMGRLRGIDPDLARQIGAHLPPEEHAELLEVPGITARAGDTVRALPPREAGVRPDPRAWSVEAIEDGVARLRSGKRCEERSVEDLVVLLPADTEAPVGLQALGTSGTSDVRHLAISGENVHALTALGGLRGSIDTIYLDPPYNTGRTVWIYRDTRCSWHRFMRTRLELARQMLRPTGVIIVAIGTGEHHRLRAMLDEIFGHTNFIADVTWAGGRKSTPRFVSDGTDHMLIYGRDVASWAVSPADESRDVHTLTRDQVAAVGGRWREPKPGVAEVIAAGRQAWQDSSGDPEAATAVLKEWWKSLPAGHVARQAKGLAEYFRVDSHGRVFRTDNLARPAGNGLRYELPHPVTGEPAKIPAGGWRLTEQAMSELVDQGLVYFGADHTYVPLMVRHLDTNTTQVPTSVFEHNRSFAPKHLERLLGDTRFPYPKDHTVLMRWIGMVTPKDGIVLDYFGGSGSTMEAVLRLNAADGGRRRCILVTSNEVGSTPERLMSARGLRPGDDEWESAGVFESVTRPRIEAVLSGHRADGTPVGNPVPGTVAFYRVVYRDAEQRGQVPEAITLAA